MPFCGFNTKMFGALVAFSEGLVEHGVIYRSQQNNESHTEGIIRELRDMDRFMNEIHLIEDPIKRRLVEGLTGYAQAFYQVLQQNNTNDYKQVVGVVSEFFVAMDKKYYDEFDGHPDDMRQLAKFLNSKNLIIKG